MHEQTGSLNWGPTRRRSVSRAKQISREMATSGSDEAIISDDLAGQHNWLASQGPLGGIARGSSSDYLPLGATGGWRTRLSWRISRGYSAKVALEFPLEAVLGKTRRTEFQRGRGKRDVESTLIHQQINGEYAKVEPLRHRAPSLLDGLF
jgi:hypothetical protein